jgi:hypothetical protein
MALDIMKWQQNEMLSVGEILAICSIRILP